MTRGGRTVRVSLSAFAEPSNVAGRFYQRLDKSLPNDAVVDAFITDGSELVSSAEGVKAPQAARYAFVPRPAGSLIYNKAGLPMAPFATDIKAE